MNCFAHCASTQGVRHMYSKFVLVVIVAVFWAACGRAELENLSADALQKKATHVVVGKVTAIYERVETDRDWTYTRYVAEIRVSDTEKGEGPKRGELLYARYWHRAQPGKDRPPPDFSGHRGLPKT